MAIQSERCIHIIMHIHLLRMLSSWTLGKNGATLLIQRIDLCNYSWSVTTTVVTCVEFMLASVVGKNARVFVVIGSVLAQCPLLGYIAMHNMRYGLLLQHVAWFVFLCVWRCV